MCEPQKETQEVQGSLNRSAFFTTIPMRLDEFLGFEFKALKNAWENDENV